MFKWIFNVFSRREKLADFTNKKSLSHEFRNRVIMLLQDELSYTFKEFLAALQRKVAFQHGKFLLANPSGNFSKSDDLLNFLLSCKDEHFLDVLEIIFQSGLPGITWPENALIPCINDFFRLDDLPYYLTGYSTESYESIFYGEKSVRIRISEFPKIIQKDSEILHQEAIEPTLTLLKGKDYIQANNEFLNALEDYRKSDFKDCLTKSGSALESVMKVLCNRNMIPIKTTDTSSVLLKALFASGQLEGYWEQPIMLISTLRNRLSSSHGAGSVAKDIPEHVARYVINSTASAILFLDSEFSK